MPFSTLRLLALAFALTGFVNAQFVQQGTKLVGAGANGVAEQGGAVALSADGNTALVGGWLDGGSVLDGGIGAVWVYTRSGGAWTQQGGKLVASDAVGNACQGWSVALSADGNTALVGGPYDDGGAGAAWVYTRSGNVWTRQGSKLVGTGAANSAMQGSSVALSADGSTAIVGGPTDDYESGAAWVYKRAGGVWTQQGGKLVGTGGSVAFQGSSVALSTDGSTAIVGGPNDNFQVGATWVFALTGGVWTQQGGKLLANDAVWYTSQGSSVALSGDGSTALVGGPGDNFGMGAVWVYTRSGGVWTQQGSKLVGTGAVGNYLGYVSQGYSVGLSSDGNTAIAGAPVDSSGPGAIWAYTRSVGIWAQLGAKLVGTGALSANQGYAVALSGDGSTALVGSPQDNGNAGAAWTFVRQSGSSGPTPTLSGIVSAGAFGAFSSVAPGSWIEIYGSNLASDSRSWTGADFTGVNAPASLDGTKVTIGGQPAFIDYISPTQVNAQVPSNVATGSQPVIVTSAAGASTASTITVNQQQPGLLAPSSFIVGGKQYVAALFSDGVTFVLPPGAIAGVPSRRAQPGDNITLYGVGFGPVTPAIPAGQVVQQSNTLTGVLHVLFGQTQAVMGYDGLAPNAVGLYQFNVVAPNVAASDTVPVTFTLGGVAGTQTLYIAVQN